MIEMMDHLGLIERHIHPPIFMTPVRAVTAKPLIGKLLNGAEEWPTPFVML